MKVYSLDTLRTFMKRKMPDSRLPAVDYQHDNKYWIHINGGYIAGPSVYQVGRLWDEVYVADNRDPLICLQDQWNTKTVFENNEKYNNYNYILPRVIEFYGGKMYELDLHSIRQLISEIGLRVWICTHEKDTILRLELSMEIPAANISGIIHPQTVNIRQTYYDQSHKIPIMQLKETFYVSASTSKIIKYDGELALIDNMKLDKITGTGLQVPVTGEPAPSKTSSGVFSSIRGWFRPKSGRVKP
ncbi:uncharacterized protein LOC111055236 [Nilaparvata lugens]|uniref:uncharacterized protein LOC111055236 n=1 Tax=Nilaparvata lugens TaxID=108931 RepID=UPI00193E45FE|nr:uncharacterized protein LOC111055236 [Nilaparvata lugens]